VGEKSGAIGMRLIAITAAAAVMLGCATIDAPQQKKAVNDFVVLSEMQEIDRIRGYQDLRFSIINEYFVVAVDDERHFLLEFDAGCRALRTGTFNSLMMDHRQNFKILHRRDTIRGCPIAGMYIATAEQLNELKALVHGPVYHALVPTES
jgi:hypothetical protein